MASEHDRAVLQAIFNPTTPVGDVPGLNQEEELTDDGEFWTFVFITVKTRPDAGFNWSSMSWYISVFVMPSALTVVLECVSACLSPSTRQKL